MAFMNILDVPNQNALKFKLSTIEITLPLPILSTLIAAVFLTTFCSPYTNNHFVKVGQYT